MFSDRNANARVGEVIADKFRLEKVLGIGAMGAVYRAVHEWTQRRVAVKLLFDDANPSESIERFFREARAATKIGHRNIVEVLDMGQHSDGTYYLVQELLEGETLRQRLDRLHKLSLTETFEALLPVMDALAAAHAAGITHRDVKPENVLLHSERRTTRAAKTVPKLIDFGVAKAGNHPVRLTAAGAVLGTPNYMSPEQIDGASTVGPPADLWAISVVLYECLCGERPFSGNSVRDVFAKVTATEAIPLTQRMHTVPDDVAAIIHRGLERDPSARFASMQAMIAAFSAVHPLAKAPSLAPLFESFAAPSVPRASSDAKTAPLPIALAHAVESARASSAQTVHDPSGAKPPTATLDLRKSASHAIATRSQLALGAALALALGAFGAFTIRGSARARGATDSEAIGPRSTGPHIQDASVLSARSSQRDAATPDVGASATDASPAFDGHATQSPRAVPSQQRLRPQSATGTRHDVAPRPALIE